MTVSVPFHSAAVEMCFELVNYLPSSVSVCPVCNAPLLLLSQETQAFRPISRQEGARVRHQYCQGGRSSVTTGHSERLCISALQGSTFQRPVCLFLHIRL